MRRATRFLCSPVTGQVDSDRIGSGMPQESSQLKLFDDIALFNAEARSPINCMEMLHIAINTALTKRGLAHISIPSDVMLQRAVPYPLPVPVTDHDASLVPGDDVLNKAAEAINASKRPAILYGAGARTAADEVLALSEKLEAPLLHTTRSKDIIDNHHPNVLGGIGIMGNHPANHAMHKADLLIIVGCNFAWRQFYPAGTPIVKIDHNPEHLATHIPVTHPVLGSAQPSVSGLLERVDAKSDTAFLVKSRKPLVKLIDDHTFGAKKTKPGKPVHPRCPVTRHQAEPDRRRHRVWRLRLDHDLVQQHRATQTAATVHLVCEPRHLGRGYATGDRCLIR